MRGDVAYLDSVYAPSFRFKHSTGTLEERGQRLAALRARRDTVFARDLDSLDVEVHGDIAADPRTPTIVRPALARVHDPLCEGVCA